MHKVVESKLVYICVCILFAVAVCISVLADGSVPAFGAGLLPESALAQAPLPPPDPDWPRSLA